MGILDHLTCHLRNLYVDQEAIIRALYGTSDCQDRERNTREMSSFTLFASPIHLAHHEKCWAG